MVSALAIASAFVLFSVGISASVPAAVQANQIPATTPQKSTAKSSTRGVGVHSNWGTLQAQIRVTLGSTTTETGERVLQVELILNGQVAERLGAVSGKADVQHFRLGPDSRSGSREPLPEGLYHVGLVDREPGLPAAMGRTFIPLMPQFSTSRSGLGIHQDADRDRGGAGTLGCLGLLTQTDVDTVARFVEKHQVKTLIVDYGLATAETARSSRSQFASQN